MTIKQYKTAAKTFNAIVVKIKTSFDHYMRHAKGFLLLAGLLMGGLGYSGVFAQGLSGDIYIGTYPYYSLEDAAYAFRAYGLADDTRFIITKDIQEVGTVVFWNKTNGHTLTITTNGNRWTISGEVDGPVILLEGAENIVFDGITPANAAAPDANKLVVANTFTGVSNKAAALHIVKNYLGDGGKVGVKNTELSCLANPQQGNCNILIAANEISVSGCYLHGAFDGVVASYVQNLSLTGNIVRDVTCAGFSITGSYPGAYAIENNDIGNITGTSSNSNLYGIFLNSTGWGTISLKNNYVHNINNQATGTSGAYGLFMTVDANTTISGNNCDDISNQGTDESQNAIGISCLILDNTPAILDNNIVTNIRDFMHPVGIKVGASDYRTDVIPVTNCKVDGIVASGASSNAQGIEIRTMANVTKCTISNISSPNGLASGIFFYHEFNTPSLLLNNMIFDIKGTTAIGINLNHSGNACKVYHNSVHIKEASSEATCLASSISSDIRNNLLVNTASAGFNHAIVIQSGFSGAISGNRYHSAAGTIGKSPANISYTNINKWNNATGDFSTHVAMPVFVSATDLHLAGTSTNNPLLHTRLLTDVTTDFDNHARTACSNAAGADNFTSQPVFTASNFKVTPPLCPGGALTVNFEAAGDMLSYQYSLNSGTYKDITVADSVMPSGTIALHFNEILSNGDYPFALKYNNCQFANTQFAVNLDEPVTTALFVKPVSSGDGSGKDWDNAFDGRRLAWYLKYKAADNTKIYVAAGTYLPYLEGCDNASTQREYTFDLVKAVEMRGGYSATATGIDLSSYAPFANITKLSGEIQGDGNYANNSYHVVWGHNAGAVVDGFHISDGYADGTGPASTISDRGGGVYLSNALTLKNVTITGNRTVGPGGGVFASSQSTSLTLSGSFVSNNQSKLSGGGIYTDVSLTLDNTVISGNKAGYNWTSNTFLVSGSGGGVYVYLTLTLKNNVVFEDNMAAISGGAVYKTKDDKLSPLVADEAVSLFFDRNVAVTENGGAVYSNVTSSLRNATITNNVAGGHGGGIHADGSAALTLQDATISGNKSGYNSTTQAYNSIGHGGGIRADNALTLKGSIILENNIAQQEGGAIWKNTGAFTTTDAIVKINNNKAITGDGGGVRTSADFAADGWTITDNEAGGLGGGIRTYSGVSIVLSNSSITGNSSKSHGGGFYTNGNLKLSDVIVSDNKAGYNKTTQTFAGNYDGGGIYANNSLTLSGTLTCNSNAASQNGGGIYKYTTNSFDAIGLTSLQIENNKAGQGVTTGAGGGIFSPVALNLSGLTKGSVSHNSTPGSGGGIYITAEFVINNTTISYNTGTVSGGGVYAGSQADVIMKNVIINNNHTNATGGGIYAAKSVDLTDITLNNNTALTAGGGVNAVISAKITNISAKNNSAKANGGAICANGILTFAGNDTISGNKAGYDNGSFSGNGNAGGGIFVSGALTLSDTLICTGNTSSGQGGGIHVTGNVSAASLKILKVDNNQALLSTGGGINCNVTTATIDFGSVPETSFSGNMAYSNGGGVYSASPLTINNATVSGNKAGYNNANEKWLTAGSGGGIYAGNNLTLKGGIVCDRDSAALHGGGIYVHTTVFNSAALTSLTINNSCADAAKKGKSSGNGGGICFNATTNLSVTLGKSGVSVKMTGNRASQGGAIYWPANGGSTSSIDIQNATFAGNTSWGSGGAIWIGGNNVATAPNMPVALANVTMSGNKSGWDYTTNAWVADGAGGAVQLDNNKIDFILKGNVVFENNETGNAGGAICANANIAAGSTITGTVLNGLTSLKITGNRARGTSGGGIHTSNVNASIALENATITGNMAKTNGGGIYAFGTLTLDGGNTISDNNAGYDVASGVYSGNNSGGGIYANNSLTLSGTLVCNDNNASQNGGGIYKSATNSFEASELTSLQVDGNGAGKGVTTGAGGGIYTLAALDLGGLTQGSVSNNAATSTGGGIHAANKLTLNNTTVNDNKALSTGGGIHLVRGATITNATISNNRAASIGGGIAIVPISTMNDTLYLRGNIVFANDSVVGGSGSNRGGGAIAFGGSKSQMIYATATDGLKSLLIDACWVAGDLSGAAGAHDGGAIGINVNPTTDYPAIILKGELGVPITIRNCFAARKAGAILACGELELEGVLFENNTSISSATNTVFRSKSSGTTPGLISNCTFKENKNTGTPGEVIKFETSTTSNFVTNCTFYKNGSNIFSVGTPTTVSFCTFYGNNQNLISGSSTTNTVQFNGNIVQDNIGGQTISKNYVAGSYNIVGLADDANRLGATGNNVVNTDVNLLFDNIVAGEPQLADNSGTTTPVLFIKKGSPAHNLIPQSVAWKVAADQIGTKRPYGCRLDAGSVEIKEDDVPFAVTFISPLTEACTGDHVPFSVGTFFSYNWSIVSGTGGIAESYSVNPATFTWALPETKVIKVAVKDADGCPGEGQASILIKQRSETGPLYRVPNLQ